MGKENMVNKFSPSVDADFIIRQMQVSDMNDLLDAGFCYKYVLDQALGNRFRKLIGLVPRSIGMVIYNGMIGKAVGFLSLVKHTSSIYSIKFVFVAPSFRKKGLATKLLNYSCSLARKRGVKKIFLNANSNDPALLVFYTKRKFALIVDNSMLWGSGAPARLACEGSSGSSLRRIRSKEDITRYFDLYCKIMGRNWVDFFGLTASNWVRGFTGDFKFFFAKRAFVDDSGKVLVLVSKFPFLSNGFVELYGSSDSAIQEVMGRLSEVLVDMSIKYVKISAFNLVGNGLYSFLEARDFHPFQAMILGQ